MKGCFNTYKHLYFIQFVHVCLCHVIWAGGGTLNRSGIPSKSSHGEQVFKQWGQSG